MPVRAAAHLSDLVLPEFSLLAALAMAVGRRSVSIGTDAS
jgi:hypothetical protein